MSSNDLAVRVRGLSKSYTIARSEAAHTTAAEALVHRLKHPFQRSAKQTFRALQDVDFDIRKGDVVGIIGRNGAGKSTLLKILSRITAPTTGQIDLYGRVGSLLEVGTGFHPELTGRENIFLNGAILGMSRREIARQFDAIVDFAGTETFLDTPVKRYSSGMYVRLAFAVAAHLNPEILIVDEVLAVGDAEFQKKCLGKMKDVACSGRTVLFVSHNLTAVVALCNRGLLLKAGTLVSDGAADAVIREYTQSMLQAEMVQETSGQKDFGFRRVFVQNLDDPSEQEVQTLQTPHRYAVVLRCGLPDTRDCNVGFTLINEAEICVASCSARDSMRTLPTGEVCLQVELPIASLPTGNYRIEGAVWDGGKQYDQSDGLAFFAVINTLSLLDAQGSKPRGATLITHAWQTLSDPVLEASLA